jgi:hypothetical protein
MTGNTLQNKLHHGNDIQHPSRTTRTFGTSISQDSSGTRAESRGRITRTLREKQGQCSPIDSTVRTSRQPYPVRTIRSLMRPCGRCDVKPSDIPATTHWKQHARVQPFVEESCAVNRRTEFTSTAPKSHVTGTKIEGSATASTVSTALHVCIKVL